MSLSITGPGPPSTNDHVQGHLRDFGAGIWDPTSRQTISLGLRPCSKQSEVFKSLGKAFTLLGGYVAGPSLKFQTHSHRPQSGHPPLGNMSGTLGRTWLVPFSKPAPRFLPEPGRCAARQIYGPRTMVYCSPVWTGASTPNALEALI